MCGIVGLFLKDKELKSELGAMLCEMMVTMSDRGPDSAGIAIYSEPSANTVKLTLQSGNPDRDFNGLEQSLNDATGAPLTLQIKDTHGILQIPADKVSAVRNALSDVASQIRILSAGESIEVYKEVGLPQTVVDRFALNNMAGTHGIGHTRMATESAVTTLGAHPFSTGDDQCLVHNGSLSNHNRLRQRLASHGVTTETENDTEVGAAYLTWKMQQGSTLDEALNSALDDLDGFYTFVVGTRDGFGVLRDPIACKPAVMAQTDQYVAFGSEYRALVGLPGINTAQVWEPEPATVYFWSH
jgi:amidophosphoribosyltransferase